MARASYKGSLVPTRGMRVRLLSNNFRGFFLNETTGQIERRVCIFTWLYLLKPFTGVVMLIASVKVIRKNCVRGERAWEQG